MTTTNTLTQTQNSFKILLFYKYVTIADTTKLKTEQITLCKQLNLTGRIIIANEGINATLEGTTQNINTYIQHLKSQKDFEDTHIKLSEGTGQSFPKLSVKIKPEIVNLHLGTEDINPNEITGKHITAQQLHQLFNSNQEFYIIDMRNDYEHKVGHFENSILPNLKNFRDLPAVLKDLEHLKHKKIVTVCTGGVRCEKASGYLVSKGFTDVSQLFGGIVTYMESYPNENFLGELYVFDNRLIMGFNLNDTKHKVIGTCEICGNNSNNFANCNNETCHKHVICCPCCTDTNRGALCKQCFDQGYKLNLQTTDEKELRETVKNQAIQAREKGFEKISLKLFDTVQKWDEANNNTKGLIDVLGHKKIALTLMAAKSNKPQIKENLYKRAVQCIEHALQLIKQNYPQDLGKLAINQVHYCSLLLETAQNTKLQKQKDQTLNNALTTIEQAIQNLPGTQAHKAWALGVQARILFEVTKVEEAIETLHLAERQIYKGYDQELNEENNKDGQGEMKLKIWLSGIHLYLAQIYKATNKTWLAQTHAQTVLNLDDNNQGYLNQRKAQARELLNSLTKF